MQGKIPHSFLYFLFGKETENETQFQTERTPWSFAACNAFILQAILGLVPVCVTQAAPLTVETWDSDKVVDYGYRFNMKFQPGITTYESFGCDNLDRKLFQTMEKANVTQSAFV